MPVTAPLPMKGAEFTPFIDEESSLNLLNAFILSNMRTLEMIGVIMRIFSFSLVSWLGPQSPFMFVWIFNTVDATLLTWCAALRRDAAYTLLNAFWILIGIVGVMRAAGVLGAGS